MLSDREAALATALKSLRMLRNECHAIRAMSYDAIKDTAGYTNLKVWISRIEEADTLLAKAAAADPVPVCQWRETQADVYFGTVRPGCREGGSLAAEDVTEFKACPYCGKPLALVPAEQTNKE